MIKTFEEFKASLTKLMQVRSANYVNTDCDINVLIDAVWAEMSDIILDWKYEDHIIDNTTNLVMLDPDDDTAHYKDPIVITCKRNDFPEYDVSHRVNKLSMLTYDITDIADALITNETATLTFVRPMQYAIDKLPPDMYDALLPVISYGVMFYIENAIPSQVDNPISNYTYKAFQAAKQQLQSQYPQVVFSKKEKAWT